MKWRHCAFPCFPRQRRLYYKLVLCTHHSHVSCAICATKMNMERRENSRQMCRKNKLQNTKRWAEGRKRVQLATLTKWNRKFDCGQRWALSLSIALLYHHIPTPVHSSYLYLPSWLSDWMVYVWHLWPVTEVFFWRRLPSARRYKLKCTCKQGKR